MRIYDISQEVFTCKVFPGDASPQRKVVMKRIEGDVCNLTEFTMCAHNGTHVDAPFHFIDDGKKIDEIPLESFIGCAYVVSHEGEITAKDAEEILKKAAAGNASKRILIKGKAVLTEEGAKVFASARILLFGNESQTVGPENAPMQVHLIMLGADIVLLEGIRLGGVDEGVYMLNAAPINLGASDGAPCRAVLMQDIP